MKKKILSILTVVALLLSMVLVFSGCTKTIKLEDYVFIEVTGANGYGKATVEVDWDKIQMDFGDKVDNTDQAGYCFSRYGDYTLADAVSEAVTYELSQYDRLSNGDTITMTWEPDVDKYLSAFDVELSYDDIEYTVEGLEEVSTFDAFSSIDVVFEGVAPDGYARISVGENSEFDSYDFSIDKSSELSNGDTIKITISEDAIIEHIEQYGSAPAESEKTYTVSNLEFYATKVAEINSDSLDKMKAQADDVHKSKIANWASPDTCKGATFVGTYFLSAKNMESESTKNILYLIYKIDVTTATETFSYYWYLKYDNITVLPDGSVSIDYQDYEAPYASYFFGLSGEGFLRDDLCYEGYEKLDDLYNNCVTKVVDRYTCENTVK